MAENLPVVETQMLIRKPARQVFEAFINPAVTTKFWFTKSDGPLETGKTLTWEWEMYGVSTQVQVKEIVPDQKIHVEWGDPATTVEFLFEDLGNDTTYVIIKNYGYTETGEALIRTVIDNTGGFTTVLDGAKAYLEFGIRLNLVGDKFLKK